MSEPEGHFKPTNEHEDLQAKVGTWDVECAYFMDPTGEPMKARGQEVIESLGPFWTVGRFECELPFAVIHGRSVTGYDPVKEKYLGTWHDSTTPFHYSFEGYKKDGVIHLKGENRDPMSGKLTTYRSEEELVDYDRRLFSLYVDYEGTEVMILQYEYTRSTG